METHHDLMEDDVYRVEAIVGYNPDNDLFNVKWEGYDESENTWEPREHLTERLINGWFCRANGEDAWLVDDVGDSTEPAQQEDKDDGTFTMLKKMIDTAAYAYCLPHVVTALVSGAVQSVHRSTPREQECFCCNQKRWTNHMVTIDGMLHRIGPVCAQRVRQLNMAYRHLERMQNGAKMIKDIVFNLQ